MTRRFPPARPLFGLIAAAIAVAACNRADPPPPAPAAPVVDPLAALPAVQRDATLFRAIRDAGQPCQTVTAATPVKAPGTGAPAYLATCEDGGRWQITIGRNGGATVLRAG